MSTRPGGLVGGRYEVVREVGRGGVSRVFLAKDLKLGTELALKVSEVPGPMYDDFKSRFQREARLGAKLGKDPGFVRALDWGEIESDRSLYLAMDYVADARPLDLRQSPLDQRLRRLLLAARLLGRVHRLGIVHRDLKPDNFLVDGVGRLYLADFGLAKEMDEKPTPLEERTSYRTGTGLTLGTPLFMSPEQFGETRDVDTRTDVYALGVMLYFLLTGTYPYPGGNAHQVMTRQMEVRYKGVPAPTPARADSGADPILVKLCLDMLQLEAAQRPSAEDVVRRLEAFLGPATTNVKRPGAPAAPPRPSGVMRAAPPPSGRLPAVTGSGRVPSPSSSEGVVPVAPAPPIPTPPPGASSRAQLRIDAHGLTSRDVLWKVRRELGPDGFRKLVGSQVAVRIADERPLKGLDASAFRDKLGFLLPRPQVARSDDGQGVVLGRVPDNDLVLPFTTISKRQLRFDMLGSGDWTVLELGSRNGTTLNGVALAPGMPRILSEGDSLCLSEHLIVEFLTPGRIVEWVEERGDTGLGPLAEKADGLDGQFKGDELVELLQMVEFHRKTGALRVHDAKAFRGAAFFSEGRLRAAETTEGKRGEGALRALLGVTAGRFRFTPTLPQGFAPEVDLPLSPILFEAMRQRDERSRPPDSNELASGVAAPIPNG